MVAHLIEFATNHYLLVGIFVVLLALLVAHTMQGGGRSLSTAELTALVNKDAGVVVDIRPSKEYAAGHIVGALNIPQDKLTARVGELEKHKAKTIILVDAMGQTAGTHARVFVDQPGQFTGAQAAAAALHLISDQQRQQYDEDTDEQIVVCLLYTSPSPRDQRGSRMPSSA